MPGVGSATGSGAGSAPQATKGRQKPPSALPGTRTEKVEPAPADRIANEMAPNEALFDGINRGDMAAVKDAVNRGAELTTRNILGLTPIDLSVDLGYNDITFLLLSMRGAGGNSGLPPAPKTAKADLRALAKAEAKAAKTSSKAAQGIAPPPPAAPKLFANDGGTPIPSAGFLGYGSQR